MLAIIGIILIALWLVGVLLHVAGGLIHLLLVVAAILVLLHFLTGARKA
ncbi:MAG TPA: lmo0937 family membrane protein [Chthoniobacter sp.]|nr:lmo0937 family membrane protein [Chthoniobacter sp.]